MSASRRPPRGPRSGSGGPGKPGRPTRPSRPGRPTGPVDPRDPKGPVDPRDPKGPVNPRDPKDQGPKPGADPLNAFAALDPDRPLALLPLRLEARFLPKDDPRELVVRIFPDLIHADAHRPELTDAERAARAAYLRAVAAAPDAETVTEARRWLATRFGAHRAVWIARAEGKPASDDTDPRPAMARLLPSRFAVTILRNRDPEITVWGNPVPRDLPMAPALVDFAGGPEELLAAQGLRWMVDIDEAVAVGMAVRIPAAGRRWLLRVGANELVVVGASDLRPAEAAAELERLLDAHRYTHGLDVVPPGTPTNTTDDGPSGVSLAAPDLDALFAADTVPPLPGAEPGAGLLRARAGSALRRALGIDGAAVSRTVHSGDTSAILARAMNAALWPATLGHFLTSPLARAGPPPVPLLPGRRLTALRAWFADWVRGGGPLPTLRCGPQPYGLLPVALLSPVSRPVTLAEHIAERVDGILYAVDDSVPDVAQLDPDAADSPPSGTPGEDTAVLAEVLGAVPHPVVTGLTAAQDRLMVDEVFMVALLGLLDIGADQVADTDGTAFPSGDNPVQQELDDWMPRILAATDAGDQTEHAVFLGSALRTLHNERGLGDADTTLLAMIGLVDDNLVPLLAERRDRAAEALPGSWDLPDTPTAVGADGVVRLAGTSFSATTTPAVEVVATGQEDVDGVVAWMDGLLADLDRRAGGEAVVYDHAVPVPVLRQLLQAAVTRVDVGQVAAMREGLQGLRDHLVAGASLDDLERAMRESLGVVAYRVDAWATALASEDLATRRDAHPQGLGVGAYGFLLDVRPRGEPVTQGFIHAPSLDQAATAAVLRSGWSAFGGQGAQGPLAVDLSAPRVRAARGILDAVRQGQDLSRHLGVRFERTLHDRHLDEWIDDIRLAVHEASGARGPRRGVVDGLVLARAYGEGITPADPEPAVRRAVDLLTPTPAVLTCLRELAGDIDAVTDLLTAQAVHGLLRGTDADTQAALSLLGSGVPVVPPLTVADGPRDAVAVTHRVLAAWNAAEVPPADPASPLGVAEPALAAWAASILPTPADVAVRVVARDDGGAQLWDDPVRLDALGLAPLELAMLCGSRETQRGAVITRLVAAHVRESKGVVAVEVDPGWTPPEGVSLDEFGLLAAPLVALLGHGRPLRAGDLMPSAAGEPETVVDDNDLTERADGASAALAGAAGALRGVGAAAALCRLAAAGVPGAPAALEDTSHIDSVEAAVADRLAVASTLAGVERLAALAGGRVPVLPRILPPAAEERAASAAVKGRRAAVIADGHRWLRQAARVRDAVGTLHEVLTLAEAVAGAPRADLAAVQSPDAEGLPWVAVGRPAGVGEHLTLVSVTGEKPLVTDDRVCGLLIDAWVDAVPGRSQPTGVAVHFDAPTARPPQAILLGLAPADGRFDAEYVRALVLHALDLAKVRAVGPSRIEAFRHLLPAAYLPDATVVSGSMGEVEA